MFFDESESDENIFTKKIPGNVLSSDSELEPYDQSSNSDLESYDRSSGLGKEPASRIPFIKIGTSVIMLC